MDGCHIDNGRRGSFTGWVLSTEGPLDAGEGRATGACAEPRTPGLKVGVQLDPAGGIMGLSPRRHPAPPAAQQLGLKPGPHGHPLPPRTPCFRRPCRPSYALPQAPRLGTPPRVAVNRGLAIAHGRAAAAPLRPLPPGAPPLAQGPKTQGAFFPRAGASRGACKKGGRVRGGREATWGKTGRDDRRRRRAVGARGAAVTPTRPVRSRRGAEGSRS